LSTGCFQTFIHGFNHGRKPLGLLRRKIRLFGDVGFQVEEFAGAGLPVFDQFPIIGNQGGLWFLKRPLSIVRIVEEEIVLSFKGAILAGQQRCQVFAVVGFKFSAGPLCKGGQKIGSTDRFIAVTGFDSRTGYDEGNADAAFV
jgi:hypothetical protein